MKRICVFCGSSMGRKEEYREAAREVGNYFVSNNIGLIYGGANVGLMQVIADTMLRQGAEVIGIMPRRLVEKEVAHKELSQMIIVESMAERKEMMAKMSDGFITLPGGFGTIDELSEMLTFNQLRITDKPLGILNIKGYFNHLLHFFDCAVEEGFVRAEHRNNLFVSESIEELITKMKYFQPVSMQKWIEDIKTESRR